MVIAQSLHVISVVLCFVAAWLGSGAVLSVSFLPTEVRKKCVCVFVCVVCVCVVCVCVYVCVCV